MTPTAIIYTISMSIVTGILGCFIFWLFLPSLERVRDKWRERAAKAPLTPENEAELLKKLRMQQASLKRLEQFQASLRDTILYLVQLLGAGMLCFVTAVCLYVLRAAATKNQETLDGFCVVFAVFSFSLFVVAILEGRNMTDAKVEAELVKLRAAIQDAKTKLKIQD